MGLGLLSATSASATTGDTSFASSSTGILAQSVTAGSVAGTATILQTGQPVLTVLNAAGTISKTTISAGASIIASANETVSADQQSATTSESTSGSLTLRITGAVGSTFTISTSTGSTLSNQVLYQLITVTIAGSSVAGTATAAQSTVTWAGTATLGLGTGGVDSATGAETTTGNKLFLNIQVKDAYKAAITSGTGSLVVTASSGANVAFGAAGTYSTAVLGSDPSNVNIWVTEATSGAGWSGTVSVTYNGVVLATKSGKITGNVATLTVATSKIGKTSASNAKALTFKAADAAGNQIGLAASAVLFSSSSNTAVVSTAAGANGDSTSTDVGYASVTCGIAGTSNVVLQTTIASTGVVVKSNSVAVLCGGAADTFSVTLDKAKYAQGDVATVTLTFKDIKGNLANSYDSATSLNGAKDSISFPMAKQIGSITGADVTDNAGKITYKFNVGDVSSFAAGKYNVVATFPTPANATAQTAAYEVSGSGGVSNSDILASIVKLITAINKQIAALQKLLLKK
jgi:hypothetical protein